MGVYRMPEGGRGKRTFLFAEAVRGHNMEEVLTITEAIGARRGSVRPGDGERMIAAATGCHPGVSEE